MSAARAVFSDISGSPIAQRLLFVLIGFQIILFTTYVFDSAGTLEAVRNNTYTCWPFFQECAQWYVLDVKPSYSQTAWYALMFLLQGAALWALSRGAWLRAQLLYSVTLLSQMVLIFVLSYEAGEAYAYYHALLSLIVLFAPVRAGALVVVGLYVLGGAVEVFNLVTIGREAGEVLPLIPQPLTLVYISSAIALSLIGSWYLLSEDRRYRIGALCLMTLFHVYAGITFDFYYMLFIVPVIWVLFYERPLHDARALRIALGLLALLACLQVWIVGMAHTVNYTFARQHGGVAVSFPTTSGVSNYTVHYQDGTEKSITNEWNRKPCRCSPYTRWFELRNICRAPGVERISWTLDVTAPRFLWHRVVDVENACDLQFRWYGGNDWIRAQ